MFINVEQLQRWKENGGTEKEKIVERWIPVSLSLGSIESFYPEKENFANEVYFILQGSKNTHYRWKFSVEELLEISPIVKNCYYSLIRNLKFIEIIENKFYKYNLENEKITWIIKIFFKSKKRKIEISRVKAKLLERPQRELVLFQKTIRTSLPQIWISYVEYQRQLLNKNTLFVSEVEKIKKRAISDAWKSAKIVEEKMDPVKLKYATRKQFKIYLKNQN